MMYHAAKIWHVNGKTAVYVMDLASVENTSCLKIDAAQAANAKTVGANRFEIGDDRGTVEYEYSFINNTAIDAGYADVTFLYDLDTLGVRSTNQKTTVIDNYVAANDDILTDISEIHKDDAIIYIHAESTTSKDESFHVYVPSATIGKVMSISRVNNAITLEDGTVLDGSAFWDGSFVQTRAHERLVAGETYAFTLDNHGHFITWDIRGGESIGYYTGTVRTPSAHDVWWSDAELVAQFVNIETGVPFEAPVTYKWVAAVEAYKADNQHNGYYDTNKLGNADNGLVEDADNIYGYSYAIKKAGATFSANSYKITGVTYVTGDVYFDDDTTFIVASNRGDDLDVQVFNSLAAFLSEYLEAGDVSVKLENIALTMSMQDTGSWKANVVFGFDGIASTSGSYLFFPSNLMTTDAFDYHMAGYYFTDKAYLNGVPATVRVDATKAAAGIVRGFYKYERDAATGVYTLTSAVDPTDYVYDTVNVVGTEANPMFSHRGVERPFAENCLVIDLRTGSDIDKVSKPADFFLSDDFFDNGVYKANVAYTWTSEGINVVYVLDGGLNWQAVLSLSTELQEAGWRFRGPNVINDSTALVSVLLYNANVDSERIYSTVTLGGDADPSTLSLAPYVKDGKRVENVFVLSGIDPQYNSDRYAEVEISDITLGKIAFSNDSTYNTVYSNPAVVPAGTTLGEEIVATWTAKNAGAIDISKTWYMTIEYYDPSGVLVDTVKAEVKSTDGNTLSVTLNPICGGTYKLVSVTDTEPMNWDL